MEKQRFHKELAIFLAMVITRALGRTESSEQMAQSGPARAWSISVPSQLSTGLSRLSPCSIPRSRLSCPIDTVIPRATPPACRSYRAHLPTLSA
jgi:hypothetical protein